MAAITDIRPERFPWFRYDGYTFSLGLTDGTNAWLSGHSASEYDDSVRRIVVRGGMTEQTRTAYSKIEAILDAADLTLADVIAVVEYVTVAGLATYADAAAARREVFAGHEPAVATVVVQRLLRPDALIEIQVHASLGGGTGTRVGQAAGGEWRRSAVRENRDGEVVLPTVVPVDGDGDVVYPGDFPGQYA